MSATQLNLSLKVSRRHGRILIAGHLLLLLALLSLPTPLLAKVCLLIGLGFNGFYAYRSWRKQSQITHLALEYEQLAVVRRGQWYSAQGFAPVFVTSWLTILKLKVGGERHFLALWCDSGDPEQLRQLRVWLLCGRWRKRKE